MERETDRQRNCKTDEERVGHREMGREKHRQEQRGVGRQTERDRRTGRCGERES